MDLTELNRFMELERVNCEWASSQKVLDIIKEIRSELDELEAEVLSENGSEIREEMSDVFSDVLLLVHIAERDNLIDNRDEIVQRALEKKIRRKGWILNGEKLSRDESSRIWQEAKELEKQR